MNGRQEAELKIKGNIKESLTGKPRYLKDYAQTLAANDKTPSTIYRYIVHVLDFISFVENEYDINCNVTRNLRKIKTSEVNSYLASLNDKSNSFKRVKFYAIKSFFDFLESDEYISANPCNKVKLKKDRSEHKVVYLTPDEIKTVQHNILSGCDGKMQGSKLDWIKRDLAIVMLALSTGMSRAALIQINMEDINIDKSEVTVIEKREKKRVIMYSSKLNPILIDWIKDREHKLKYNNKTCDALFISNRYSRISADTVSKIVERYTYNIDKHVTPHKLRASFATNFYLATGDILATSKAMGHSDIGTTKIYIPFDDEKKRESADIMGNILFK